VVEAELVATKEEILMDLMTPATTALKREEEIQ